MVNLSNVLYDIQNNTNAATELSKDEQLAIFTEMKKYYKSIYYASP